MHQGLYLEADPLPSPAIADLPAQGIVLVLDQITDPHNVGAIFRSAAAFAASAIVTTERHSPDAAGALAKAASGAIELVPLVTVQNLARGLAELRERGFLLVGLDSEGEADLADLALRAPLALVLGAEGKGLRQLTRETCDKLARIDVPGEIKSLNVSNAAALSLYVASRALHSAEKQNGGPPSPPPLPLTSRKRYSSASAFAPARSLTEQPDGHAVRPENGHLGLGADDAPRFAVARSPQRLAASVSTVATCLRARRPRSAHPRRNDGARSRAADRRPRAGAR